MSALFGSGATATFVGVIVVIASVVFLLSGLGLLQTGYYFIGGDADIIISFLLLIVGLAYIYSEVGKPGKPKFEVELKNVESGPK